VERYQYRAVGGFSNSRGVKIFGVNLIFSGGIHCPNGEYRLQSCDINVALEHMLGVFV